MNLAWLYQQMQSGFRTLYCNDDTLESRISTLSNSLENGGVWRAKGNWADGTEYQEGNVVLSDGASYVAVSAHTATLFDYPLENSDKWEPVALRGEKGLTGDVPISVARLDQLDTSVTGAELDALHTSFENGGFAPAGSVIATARASLPTGWIYCDGTIVSRTTYAALFTAIGTTYGAGDGSTTFRLPDIRGRAVFGRDDMGGLPADRLTDVGTGATGIDGTVLGEAGGSDRHSLTAAQGPEHSHKTPSRLSRVRTGTGGYVNYWEGAGPHTWDSQTSGNGDAHPQIPPAIILNYIIKT